MDKKEYAILLLKRLTNMLEENQRAKKVYKQLQYKVPRWDINREEYWKVYNSLSNDEKHIYYKQGVIYSMSAIQRVRIELNTILIEIDKGR